jgi:NAD(P)-dependent dehydrogenase (short-subunit alcohol dehydrogenase family)
MNLEGRLAVITGGGQGLGREFACYLGELGARVVIADKDSHQAAETAAYLIKTGVTAKALTVDVTASGQVQAMADEVHRTMGPVEILINNAAVYYGINRKFFMEIEEKEWDLVMNVNIKGAWLVTRALFPHMQELGRGKVINIASQVFFTGSHHFVHYVASKGGLIGLTRALARELGSFQVTVNAVAPGFTDTEASRVLVQDINKYDPSANSLQRIGVPRDICGAVAFLASPLSDFITGQTILVDGGRHMN